MQKNKLNTITITMIVLSFIITLIMTIFTVFAAIVIKAIPPVIAILLATLFFVWIDTFYIDYYKWLNKKTSKRKKEAHKLKIKNIIITVIMFLTSFSMWSVLLGTIVLYRIFFEFQLYFLTVALVTTVYSINCMFINKSFAEF